MIGIPRDAPGAVACSCSGLPLLAICPIGHNRLVPFLLKTSNTDHTPLYGRPFRCKACGSREVTLFAIESQAELAAIQRSLEPRAPHHGANVARTDGPECRPAVTWEITALLPVAEDPRQQSRGTTAARDPEH